MNREQWLTDAIEALTDNLLKPHITPSQVTVLADARVSVGWPSHKVNRVIGQCWYGSQAADGRPQLYISPKLGDAITVLSTLLHECLHAILPEGIGHKKEFVVLGKAVGFKAPWVSTPMGDALTSTITDLAVKLPQYPHAALMAPTKASGTQKTYMLKVLCHTCTDGQGNAYVVRMTEKWIELMGTPVCPGCDERMTREGE